MDVKQDILTQQTLRLRNGEIDIQSFVNSVSDIKVFYSTPYGDHKDGKPRLFLLTDSTGKTPYLPAFTTKEQMQDFYEKAGRTAYMIMTRSVGDLLNFIDSQTTPEPLGLVIDLRVPVPPGVIVQQ